MKKDFSLVSSIKISDDVISRNLQGEFVLLNLKTGTYYGLDLIGSKTWQSIEKHDSLQKAYELLMQEFDVPEEQCKKDLLNFITMLEENKLIE